MFLRNSYMRLKPFTTVMDAMVGYSMLFRIKTFITLAMKRGLTLRLIPEGNPSFKDLHKIGLKLYWECITVHLLPPLNCAVRKVILETLPPKYLICKSVSEYVAQCQQSTWIISSSLLSIDLNMSHIHERAEYLKRNKN